MSNTTTDTSLAEARGLYLDLLKKCLTFALWDARDGSQQALTGGRVKRLLRRALGRETRAAASSAARRVRLEGRDWPVLAHTMIGMKRLDNVQSCIEDVLAQDVRGDLIETGIWRGGATILMRGVLKAYGVTDRRVWVADSFQGLPKPAPEAYPSDAGDAHHALKPLAVPLEEVQANFERYGLLDDQVQFLKGWFKDTLPAAPIEHLAVVRLDGDMYESTMNGLEHLYPKLSVGGYLIVDDHGAVPACRQAVEDYRRAHGILDPIVSIDWTGVYWRRSG